MFRDDPRHLAKSRDALRSFDGAIYVAWISLLVRHDKHVEALSTVNQLIRHMRMWPGCLDCRLLVDAEDADAMILLSEWHSRMALDELLKSREFLVLQGMRMLLRRDPQTVLDEVRSRVLAT